MTCFSALYKEEFILLIASFIITYVMYCLAVSVVNPSTMTRTHDIFNTHFMKLIQH